MAEVIRRRQRPQTGDMSSASALEDTALRRMIQQLQQQLEEVAARIPSVPESDEQSAYDDSNVKTSLDDINREIGRIRKELNLLELRVPVAKWVQVTSIETEYLVCGNYVPLQDTSVGVVNVAKANIMNGDAADYTVGQILLAVRAWHPTDIVTVDAAPLHVEWTDGTGGGGSFVWAEYTGP